MLVLALETSCDDTSVALVDDTGLVFGVATANQDTLHDVFGGVVPEIAGRKHLEQATPLIDQLLQKTGITMDSVDGIVATQRPGLIGSLIVGLVTAKTLALSLNKPFIGVHHIEGHILSAFLRDEPATAEKLIEDPYLALVVSGGHTHLYHVPQPHHYKLIGKTQDDAAGEAFDKFAKMLQLGYPGGVKVDRLAAQGDRTRFHFPRSMIKEKNYDFSFSGLKSSAQRELAALKDPKPVVDLCASYQEAIVDVLTYKLFSAADDLGVSNVVIAGGVSANSRLRELAHSMAEQRDLNLIVPPLKYCTDNAAMIGYAGALRLANGETSPQDIAPQARAELK
ncbi:MAG: tRNA (adenosine(37)-N6)-threonylcarbamoyltransferase complex transferase subunit TsaD [Bdellovibrionales bacterium]|nr:tRNA (adenosine(37)-N6)-threonylcarbamoyltransferase complex transferase subunit TsaD [Bdellovibrionales bacterium]